MATTKGAEPIRLDFQSVQQVVVTGKDGDRWCTTVKEAAAACRSALNEKAWEEAFQGFLSSIHEWSKLRSDKVEATYLGISSEGLTGVVITKGTDYRFDFDDEVTALDIDLAEKFPACRADILQAPEGDPISRIPYISIENACLVYGNSSQSSGKSRA
jgi:hypothetical protein